MSDQSLVEAAIRNCLTTHTDTIHGLRRSVFTAVADCKIEDFNAALVDLIDVGIIKIDGMRFGHVVLVM